MNRLVRYCAPSLLALAPAIAIAQPIATGSDNSVDGFLQISPDAYGSWASTTFGGGGDLFNPAGPAGTMEGIFTSGFFIFSGTSRELLSDSANWQGTYPADASLDRMITSPNMASDSNGDGVADTLQSAFTVTGGAINLGFRLEQRVEAYAPGVSFLRQTYTITNNATAPLSFSMVRNMDADLLWSGDFADDNVGTSMHGAGLGPYVYQNEVGNPAQAITLSSLAAANYYGGKNGIDPDGAGPDPAFGFGTDVQVWNNMGMPASWGDFVAGVGAGVNGDSGAAPAGAGNPPDGFIGLNFVFNLGAGESTTFEIFHTFGQSTPVPAAPSALVLLGAGAIASRRRRK